MHHWLQEKIATKNRGGAGLRAYFQSCKNCEFTGTFDVIPYFLCMIITRSLDFIALFQIVILMTIP